MISEAETAQKLENMGIEACEALEESVRDSELGDEIPHNIARLVLVSDAYMQVYSEPNDKNPETIGEEWVTSAISFAKKAIKLGRVERNFLKWPILRAGLGHKKILRGIHIVEWLAAREEVFRQNPQYHGRRFGPEFAKAVASGRITLTS